MNCVRNKTSCASRPSLAAVVVAMWHLATAAACETAVMPSENELENDAARQGEGQVLEGLLRGERVTPNERYYGQAVDLTSTQVWHMQGRQPVCIVSHQTPSLDGFATISQRNHAQYASTHGYHYLKYRGHFNGLRYMNPEASSPTTRYGYFWEKITAVQAAMQTQAQGSTEPLCQWIMWADADTLFTDFTRSIQQIIAPWSNDEAVAHGEARDLIFAKEESNYPKALINAGVFFVKNSPTGRAFLQQVMDMYPQYADAVLGDQEAIQDLALMRSRQQEPLVVWSDFSGPIHADVALAPQRLFNAFGGAEGKGYPAPALWHRGDYLAHFAGVSGKARAQKMIDMLAELAQAGHGS